MAEQRNKSCDSLDRGEEKGPWEPESVGEMAKSKRLKKITPLSSALNSGLNSELHMCRSDPKPHSKGFEN